MRKTFLLIIFLFTAVFGFLSFRPKDDLFSPVSNLIPDFTLVVLPDTQVYSKEYPEIFESQAQWIVDQKQPRNIVFVSHSGDITDSWDSKSEWENVNRALSLLDGLVPYGLLPGNHDDPKMFNRYFPYQRYEKELWWGGHYGSNNSNNYQLFSASGLEFVVINLEVNPPEAVIKWTDSILKKYLSRRAIVVSHYILDYDGFRSPAGERIFSGLSENPNLFLLLCGHVHSESRKTDLVDGWPIHQLLADYQVRPNGGDGFLRILRFVPAENKIYVQTYSPYLDQYEVDENSQFELDYKMN